MNRKREPNEIPWMTPEDICKEYRTARDKKYEVKVLSELNNCSKKAIVDILIAGGEKVDKRWGGVSRSRTEETRVVEAPVPIDPSYIEHTYYEEEPSQSLPKAVTVSSEEEPSQVRPTQMPPAKTAPPEGEPRNAEHRGGITAGQLQRLLGEIPGNAILLAEGKAIAGLKLTMIYSVNGMDGSQLELVTGDLSGRANLDRSYDWRSRDDIFLCDNAKE